TARPSPTARETRHHRASRNYCYIARRLVEPQRAVLGRDDDVFEAHAEPAREVDAGLHREGVAGDDRALVARHHVGVLVRLGADPVPDPAYEVLAEAGGGDHRAGNRIDVFAWFAHHRRAHRGLLGFHQDRVGVTHVVQRLPDRIHTRDVGAVAVHRA